MLQTCEQLAAGLGAPPSKPSKSGTYAAKSEAGENVVFGNVPLGLWVGECFLGEMTFSYFFSVWSIVTCCPGTFRAVQESWQDGSG